MAIGINVSVPSSALNQNSTEISFHHSLVHKIFWESKSALGSLGMSGVLFNMMMDLSVFHKLGEV